MPNIKDDSTVEAIAREFCTNGRNKAKTLEKMGYSKGYANTQGIIVVYSNVRVKAAIARIDKKQAEIGHRTVKGLDAMYDEAFEIAKVQKNAAAMATNITGIARLYGMDKDHAITDDKPEQLSDAEQAVLRNQSQELTKLKLA